MDGMKKLVKTRLLIDLSPEVDRMIREKAREHNRVRKNYIEWLCMVDVGVTARHPAATE
jgi:hypothetical protein